MQEVAHGGVDDGGVLLALDFEALLGVQGTGHQGTDVKAGHADGKKADGREYAETAAHIVGNHEAHVVLLGGEGFEGTLLGVGDGHNAVCSLCLAVVGLKVLLHNAESHGGLGGGAALGDDDCGDVALGGQIHEFGQVFLGEVVTGEDYLGGVLVPQLLGKVVAQGLHHALGTQVGTADADGNHKVYAFFDPLVADGLVFGQLAVGDLPGKFLPAQEVVAGAGLVFEHVKSLQGLVHIGFILGRIHEGRAAFNIYFDHIIKC